MSTQLAIQAANSRAIKHLATTETEIIVTTHEKAKKCVICNMDNHWTNECRILHHEKFIITFAVVKRYSYLFHP